MKTDVDRIIQIPIDEIRDQLVENGTGVELYLDVNIDGEVYSIKYSAY